MLTQKRANPILLVLTLAMTLTGLGCQYETRVRSTWDSWRQLEWADNKPQSKASGSGSAATTDRGYAVELARFEGDSSYSQAYQFVTATRQQTDLAQLWHSTSNGITTLYAGRFPDRDSDDAKAMLRQARSAKVNGSRPFEDAKIVKLTRAEGQVLDPRDLRTLKGKQLYTLQIGYFDRTYGSNYRRAAETAVDVLREQGEQAYYYHGPNRSMVLLNAWNYQQAFTLQGSVDRYSNLVRAVQEKYPFNVPNGQTPNDSADPNSREDSRSFLVPIR